MERQGMVQSMGYRVGRQGMGKARYGVGRVWGRQGMGKAGYGLAGYRKVDGSCQTDLNFTLTYV